MAPKRFIGILIFVHSIVFGIADMQCYTKDQLINKCQSLHGVIDGGRCFFLPTEKGNWSDGFSICSSYGAAYAQLHTQSEYSKVEQIIPTPKSGAYFAQKRNAPLVNPAATTCGPNMDTYFWYSSPTMYDQKFSAANTFIRKQWAVCQYCPAPYGECLHVWRDTGNVPPTPQFGFCGSACADIAQMVCMLQNPSQNFTKIPGKCITEQAMEQIPGSNNAECAFQCTQRAWCRAYNIHADTSMCELLTWVGSDGTAASISDPNCYHYAYVQ